MPIYEYHCAPCDVDFETLVRSASDVPRCPRCGASETLSRQFSVPAAAQVQGGSSKSSASSLPTMCGPGGCAPMGCGGGMCGL
jgi:putative FmdB family regulatory protein